MDIGGRAGICGSPTDEFDETRARGAEERDDGERLARPLGPPRHRPFEGRGSGTSAVANRGKEGRQTRVRAADSSPRLPSGKHPAHVIVRTWQPFSPYQLSDTANVCRTGRTECGAITTAGREPPTLQRPTRESDLTFLLART